MPRSFSQWRASKSASSKQEDDRKASSDREAREQVGEDREKLPTRVPEPSSSDLKPTDKLTEGEGKDRGKLPAKVLKPSPSVQKSTDKLTERGKDRDQETAEKLRQRDNELFSEISAPQPSVRELGCSVKELRENYQRNISKNAAPPPPPPPPPRSAAPTPWNRKTKKTGSRKKEEEDREAPSGLKKAKQGDVELEQSAVRSQNKESKLDQEVAKNAKISMAEVDIESDKSIVKTPKKEASKSDQEVAKDEKIVSKSEKDDAKNEKIVSKSAKEDAKNEKIDSKSEAKEEESKEKKPSGDGKKKLGLVAKVKETGKAAVEAAMKEENRPVVMIGAAVLALLVIGASLRSSSKKTKN